LLVAHIRGCAGILVKELTRYLFIQVWGSGDRKVFEAFIRITG
jgi:hypothetical protein